MRKRWYIAVVLCFSLFAGACSSSEPTQTTTPTQAPTQAPTTAPTAEPTQAPTPEPVKETVIVDNEQVTFTITGTHLDKDLGLAVDVFIENKTDKTALFTLADVSIDDFMTDPFWGTSIPGGKKAKETIYFYNVESAEKIDFTLLVLPEIEQDYYDYQNAILNEAFTYEP